MKPMLTLAAAMPGHPNGIDRGGGSKCQVFHYYDGKKRPRGASGLVRGGCFKTGARSGRVGETANGRFEAQGAGRKP